MPHRSYIERSHNPSRAPPDLERTSAPRWFEAVGFARILPAVKLGYGEVDRLDVESCSMHNACMATKTISLRLDAYEKLRGARRRPSESFSQVILRARWPEKSITAGELLRRYRERGGLLSEEDLDRIDELKAADSPPDDKWNVS